MQYVLDFPSGKVEYLLNSSLDAIDKLYPKERCIVITDTNVAGLYKDAFARFKAVVTLPAGEANKNINTVTKAISQLVTHEAHRSTCLIGIGGGMVTDVTGFIASVYMRGVPFGFVPTSLLGMVDAAIGGKNGVNVELHKNLLGVIKQPNFILYDPGFLQTLPLQEWSNGFAEIIKYACIFDEELFATLAQKDIPYYRDNRDALAALINQCADFKNRIVVADERETGRRKVLNFGHTTGHAFETLYKMPHGYAVALGMIVACMVSEKVTGLHSSVKHKLAALLLKYQLPIQHDFMPAMVTDVLKMDKKRNADKVDFITLTHIGMAAVKSIPFNTIYETLNSFSLASRN